MTIKFFFYSTILFSFIAYGALPNSAPPLPKTKGKSIKIKNTESLYRAVSKLKSNTTLLLSKGVYELSKPIQIPDGLENISIQGATGKFEDVIIKGAGMNNKAVWHGIMLNGSKNILIANLTIGWLGIHPISINPKAQNVHIYHCRLVDAGEQFIKANSGKNGAGSDNGKVEYCLIEYSKQGPPNGYTNGVDVHGGDNWEIRHNMFRNIKTPAQAKYKNVPAVLMWNGAKNTICESNTFLNCDRAIAFGLIQRKTFADHEGGIIQNNFIYVGRNKVKHPDTGIFVSSSKTKVLHNTVILNGTYPNAIEVRFSSSSDVDVAHNLTDSKIIARDKAQITESGNILNANNKLFKDPSFGDLHLKKRSTSKSKEEPLIKEDWDSQPRKKGSSTPGADQF